jgi:hypothetical protein
MTKIKEKKLDQFSDWASHTTSFLKSLPPQWALLPSGQVNSEPFTTPFVKYLLYDNLASYHNLFRHHLLGELHDLFTTVFASLTINFDVLPGVQRLYQ